MQVSVIRMSMLIRTVVSFPPPLYNHSLYTYINFKHQDEPWRFFFIPRLPQYMNYDVDSTANSGIGYTEHDSKVLWAFTPYCYAPYKECQNVNDPWMPHWL